MNLQTIKKNSEFRRIYQKKRSYADSLLVMYASPQRLESPRFGLSVSKKVGNAVVRNRIRRQIKEILRQNTAMPDMGYDIIFVARAACKGAAFSELSISCQKLMDKAISKKHVKDS